MLDVNFSFAIYSPDGSTVNIPDTTPAYSANSTGGYGSPNPTKAQIVATRFKIGNYNSIVSQTTYTSGQTLTQYEQYLKTAGADHVYDGKVISVGDYFIPPIAGITVASGDIFQETGYYCAKTSYLPTDSQNILTIPQLGISAQNQTVPDLVWDIQYEVYYPAHTLPFATTSGSQYMVTGTGTATQSGDVYRVGEVFIGDGTSVTGTATLSELASTTERVFVSSYNLQGDTNQAQLNLVSGSACTCDGQLEIAKIYNVLESFNYQEFTNNVSMEKANDLLVYCYSLLSNLKKCIQ